MRGYKACRGLARRGSSSNASKPPFLMCRRYLLHLLPKLRQGEESAPVAVMSPFEAKESPCG